MKTTRDPSETSTSPNNAWGVAIIVAITVAVAGWLYFQGLEALQAPTPVDGPEITDLPGFRPDAWFLPDEELLGFVEIPSGPFQMGSDPTFDRHAFANERWSESSYQGTVDLPVFYVSRYEVTLAQFRSFAAATRSEVDVETLGGKPDHPVGSVSWPDALAYCRWLETTLRQWPQTPSRLRRLLREGWHVSLPSEAQWEKAARGSDGRIFPWGNEPNAELANYEGSAVKPVGSFVCPECAFGLSDMSGNVWELTRSTYRPYPYDRSNIDLDLDADALWVMRGGSYSDPVQNIRAAIRGGADPGARRPFIGFRVVLTPGEP